MLLLLGTVAFSFTSSFVKLAGVNHHIRDTGDCDDPCGPIAILLHGFAGSTESWEDVAPLLARGGCRAIAIDRVGFGRTERPKTPTLPAPPPLPFGESLAEAIESAVSGESKQQSGGLSLPDPRVALALGLRDPAALAPRLPWQLSEAGEDPYSSKFAVSRALFALINDRVTTPRPIYLVGHSAGGPLALRALVESDALPSGLSLAGVALIAPAALDPREDPECFEDDDDDDDANESSSSSSTPGLYDSIPLLPEDLKKRAEYETRVAAFRAVVLSPDAFGLQTARRIYLNRDLNEAVVGQMHPRMRSEEYNDRIADLAKKYAKPIEEYPDEWDRALLNVYRADITPTGQEGLRGRALLSAAKEARRKGKSKVKLLVATGDVDPIVQPKASERVAELLGAERFERLEATGHLPMDERPEEVATLLLDFMGLQL